MKHIKLLLSPVGGRAIADVINFFRQYDIDIIGIDSNYHSVGKLMVDKFYQVPSVTSDKQNYINAVLKIIEEEKIDYFISWLDFEILLWNELCLDPNFDNELKKKFLFPIHSELITLYNKNNMKNFLIQHDFPNLKSEFITPNMSFNFPAFAKPVVGSGSKGVMKLEDKEDLNYYIRKNNIQKDDKKYTIQEFSNGHLHAVHMYTQNGKIVNSFTIKKDMMNFFLVHAEIVNVPEITKQTEKIIKLLNWSGPCNIEYMHGQNGTFMIDFNPRFGCFSTPVGRASGINIMQNLVEYIDNKEFTIFDNTKPNIKHVYRHYQHSFC